MSAMRVRRTTSATQRNAQTTTEARRGARRRAAQPVTQVRVPAIAMEKAKELAGGDMRRIKVQRDGSVVVVNG